MLPNAVQQSVDAQSFERDITIRMMACVYTYLIIVFYFHTFSYPIIFNLVYFRSLVARPQKTIPIVSIKSILHFHAFIHLV